MEIECSTSKKTGSKRYAKMRHNAHRYNSNKSGIFHKLGFIQIYLIVGMVLVCKCSR